MSAEAVSDPPVYRRVDDLAPLYALSSSAEAAVPGYWAGYRAGATGLPPTLTLDEVWQDPGGAYLFLAAAPTDPAVFLDELDAFLARVSPARLVRAVWIEDPDAPAVAWRYHLLLARSEGAGTQIVWTLARGALFELGRYAVRIGAGAALQQAEAELGHGVAVDASQVAFDAPRGSFAAAAGSAWLPLAGDWLGTWCASIELPGGEGSPDGLDALDVCLCYALPELDDPASGAVQPVPMPVLHQRGVPLRLALSFDPLHPLVVDRTALRFDPAAAPVLGSTLVTPLGYPATLAPVHHEVLGTARLAFGRTPYAAVDTDGAAFHLSPDGPFRLEVPAEGASDPHVALGLSGTEYVALAAGGALAVFRAGQPAYAPGARRPPTAGEAGVAADGQGVALTPLATTSWVTFLPPEEQAGGLTYYAQPRRAPLFAGLPGLPEGFLPFHAMPAGTLPDHPVAAAGKATAGATGAPAVVPVGAFAGLAAEHAEAARLVEAAALAPRRRAGIPPPAPPGTSTGAPSGTPAVSGPSSAVTPQGLVALLDAENQWAGLVLAHLPDADAADVTLTRVGTGLRETLQSDELFCVASNPEAFMEGTSVAYRLDPRTLPLLAPAGVDPEVVAALDRLLGDRTPPYPTFPDETSFVTAIESAVPPEQRPAVLSVAGLLKADLQGWVFQLSPRSWRTPADDPESPTVALFKYCGRSLAELVADPASWSWPAAAADPTGDVGPTQRVVLDVFAQAAAAPDGPYRRFHDEVVANPHWTGTLFLNAPVSIAELPEDLQFVAAGIDERRFFAHHVGFSVTPVEQGSPAPTLGRTAAFGLISYADPTDLYLDANVPFAFKTQALDARFANAGLADFSARVELMANRLFGAVLTKRDPEHGNNLVLEGALQRQNGTPSYAFTLRGENYFDVAGSALSSIEVLGLQLQTSTGTTAEGVVEASFVLTGNLRFGEIETFDAFSYGPQHTAPPGETPADGYLRFGNLAVRMSFPLSTPRQQAFTSTEDRLSFDLSDSLARPGSLARRFPVRVTGAVAVPAPAADGTTGQRPADLGYAPVLAPLEQAVLAPPWFGFEFTLQLGTFGALAGSRALDVTLLAAWAPGVEAGTQPPVYLGLRLPGGGGTGINWPLQGVLKLGARSVEFEVDDTSGQRAYLLRLRQLALSVLGLSFPPGNTELLVFGDPDADGTGALGWFAGYDRQGKPAARAQRALVAGRRLARPPARGVDT